MRGMYTSSMMKLLALTLCVPALCAPALAQDAAAFRKQGDDAAKEKRWADAISAYEKARPSFEKDIVFINSLANAHFFLAEGNVQPLQHFTEADKLYNMAVRLNQSDSVVRGNLGNNWKAWGEWETDAALKKMCYSMAMAAYQKAISLGNDGDWIHYGLGFSLFRLGKYVEAEPEARKAAMQSPKIGIHQSLVALTLYRQEKYAEAEAPFRAAYALLPKDLVAATNVGAVLVKLGRRDEARPFIQEARRMGLKDDYFAVKELGLAGTPLPAAPALSPKKLAFKSGAQLLNALLEMQKNIEDANARPASTLALKNILTNVETLESKESNKIVRKISADGLKETLPQFFGLFLLKQESAVTSLTTRNTFPKAASRLADSLEKLVREVRTLKVNFTVPSKDNEPTPLEYALRDIEKQGKTWPDRERGQVEKALKDLLQVLQDASKVSEAARDWADRQVNS